MGLNVDTELELPITLISEGSLIAQNLKIANKSREWLDNVLKQHHCIISQVYLFTLTQSGKINLIRKEKSG